MACKRYFYFFKERVVFLIFCGFLLTLSSCTHQELAMIAKGLTIDPLKRMEEKVSMEKEKDLMNEIRQNPESTVGKNLKRILQFKHPLLKSEALVLAGRYTLYVHRDLDKTAEIVHSLEITYPLIKKPQQKTRYQIHYAELLYPFDATSSLDLITCSEEEALKFRLADQADLLLAIAQFYLVAPKNTKKAQLIIDQASHIIDCIEIPYEKSNAQRALGNIKSRYRHIFYDRWE